MSNLSRLVQDSTRTFLRLAALTADAEEVQWEAGHHAKPREDTTERAKGEVSNPTMSTALDARRLDVRLAYEEATIALEKAREGLSKATRHLEDALTRWAGDDD